MALNLASQTGFTITIVMARFAMSLSKQDLQDRLASGVCVGDYNNDVSTISS